MKVKELKRAATKENHCAPHSSPAAQLYFSGPLLPSHAKTISMPWSGFPVTAQNLNPASVQLRPLSPVMTFPFLTPKVMESTRPYGLYGNYVGLASSRGIRFSWQHMGQKLPIVKILLNIFLNPLNYMQPGLLNYRHLMHVGMQMHHEYIRKA